MLLVYQRVPKPNPNLVGGIPTPLKNMLVSWDDEIPNISKNHPNVPNHQPVIDIYPLIFSN